LAVLALATLVVAVLLGRTINGRHLFAVGGDPGHARASGLPVSRVLVATYALASALAAVAGVILAARATIGSPTAGQGLELSAITVVVVGGTSLLGGRGSLVGTLGGVVLLALITSSMTLLQLPSTWTDLVRGVVIIVAAAVFVTRSRT
jgi:ribose transport system permease protein